MPSKNPRVDVVTITPGTRRKIVGGIVLAAGLILAAATAGATHERWRPLVCLIIALIGGAIISPTDRLKLDFTKRRYLRSHGWLPFLQFSAGSFDDLEGISILEATITGVSRAPRLRVVTLNWAAGQEPFELAQYDEAKNYDSSGKPIVGLLPKGEPPLTGEAAAERRAEEFRKRFGFQRIPT